jgi:hypothetical protein
MSYYAINNSVNQKSIRDKGRFTKMDTTPIVGVICTGTFLIVLFLPLFFLSQLLKIQYDDFHEQWEKDGRPNGMPFWFPIKELQDGSLLGFRSYPWFMGYLWLFKTPDWVKGHQTATKTLRYYRIVSYIIYIGLFSACLLVLFLVPK